MSEPIYYPKINTIWKREPVELDDGERNPRAGCILEGEFSEEDIGDLTVQEILWNVTEKIHGMNCRINFNMERGDISFAGRTAKHAWSKPQKAFLLETFTHKKMFDAFPPRKNIMDIEGDTAFTLSYASGVLFGELVGDKAQKGGSRYCPEGQDFAIYLFDAHINGTWLRLGDVADIAEKLGVQMVPFLGCFHTLEAIGQVKYDTTPLKSKAAGDDMPAEGIVATVSPMMMDRVRGVPIRWKIKHADYERLRRLEDG